MRVYITGIEGMLGSSLAHLHLRNGDVVRGCDVWKTPSNYSRFDIRDFSLLSDDLNAFRPDRVYHCAAMLGVHNTEAYPRMCRVVNEGGTSLVLKASKSAGARDFVFLSSSEVYGNGYDFQPFSEESPLLGDNVYAISKKNSEIEVLQYSEDMRVIITRMFNCFGIGQVKQFFIPKAIDLCLKERMVPIYGSFENKRSYLFGHDAAQHIIDVANIAPNREIVNVAHPDTYTLGEVYEKIVAAIGRGAGMSLRTGEYDDRPKARDIPNRIAVIDKLRTYSKHTPMTLDASLQFLSKFTHTLKEDWDYEREEG